MVNSKLKKCLIITITLVAVVGAGAFLWFRFQVLEKPATIASGNGRIEATEIDIATKYQGRIAEILCREGDFLEADQVVARMDIKILEAQLRQGKASVEQAHHAKSYAQALVQQRKIELIVARKDYDRSKATYESNMHAIAIKQLDHDRSTMEIAAVLLAEAEAQALETEAAMNVAIAKTEEIEVNINDCILITPIRGRVLYRLAEPGEVLTAGGKVLTVLDLTDVYMTIFLPTMQARQSADRRGGPACFRCVAGYYDPCHSFLCCPQCPVHAKGS